MTLSDPRVEQTSLRRSYLVPSSTTAAAGEGPALDVLAQLMGGGSNSYLYRALVVDRPLAPLRPLAKKDTPHAAHIAGFFLGSDSLEKAF